MTETGAMQNEHFETLDLRSNGGSSHYWAQNEFYRVCLATSPVHGKRQILHPSMENWEKKKPRLDVREGNGKAEQPLVIPVNFSLVLPNIPISMKKAIFRWGDHKRAKSGP